MSNPARVGLYGGTFDPIHSGHLHLVSEILRRNLVDRLVVIPAGNPWMRENDLGASVQDRLEMVKLAVGELPSELQERIEVSDIEIRREGPTYTIDTVEALKKESPDSHFVLILGSDAFADISKWHRSEDLKKLVEIMVVARDGDGLDIDALDVSSTQVREDLKSSKYILNGTYKDLPESIWKYIQERNLYASQ